MSEERACFRSSRRLFSLLSLFALALVLAVGGTARADGPAPEKAAAQQMFSEAMDLRARGELQAALVKFRLAHRLGNTPATGLELGRTLVSLGKLVEAREILEGVLRIVRPPKESKVGAAARVEAASLAQQVIVRTPTLLVRLVGPAAARAHVDLDGAPLEAEKIGVLLSVDPGVHHLTARDDAALASADVQLAEGESRTVTLTVDGPRPEPATPAPAPPPALAPASAPARTSNLVYVGMATTGVAIAVGAVFGVLTFDQVSTLKGECNQNVCPPSRQAEIDTVHTRGAISTVAFVVAGVALVATLTAALWPSSSSSAKNASLGAPLLLRDGIGGRF